MKIRRNLGTCVAGMVRSFARAVRKRKKLWRESAVHEVLFAELFYLRMKYQNVFLIYILFNLLQIRHQEIADPVNNPQV